MEFDGNLLGFNNMTPEQQNRILDYKLQVYICEGSDEEKIKWFQRINIAGEKLTDQEILNAIYAGSWTTQAKRRFSKTGCVAYRIASDFMSGSPIRQDYFETALQWIGDAQGKSLSARYRCRRVMAVFSGCHSLGGQTLRSQVQERDERRGMGLAI